MKKLITLLAIFNLVFAPLAQARLSEVDRSIIEKDRQLLSNPGYESGTATWAVTGSPSFTLETASPAQGKVHGKIDFSAASEALTGEAVTIPPILQGRRCQVKVEYKSASLVEGDVELQAYDGSAVLAKLDLPAHADWGAEFVEFDCPSSGTIAPRLVSTANAALIEADQWHVGGSLARSKSAIAEVIAHASYAATSSCIWDRTGTALGAFSTQANCPAITVHQSTYTVDATDNDLPDIDFDSLPPGRYVVSASLTQLGGALSNLRTYAISDGTSTVGKNSTIEQSSVTTEEPMHLTGVFEYTTAGARNFAIHAAADSSTARITNDVGGRLGELTFTVTRYPLGKESSISFDLADWKIDANIGGANIAMGTSAQTAYVGMTNGGLDLVVNTSVGSAGAEIACATTEESSGLTCTGDESNGLSFTIPEVGEYKACAAFGHEASVGGAGATGIVNSTFQIVETGNANQVIAQEGKDRKSSGVASQDVNQGHVNYTPLEVCGTFNFASAGKKTLRLFYEQSVSGTVVSSNVFADRDANNGQRDIHWTVEKVGVNHGGITFDNAVASTDQSGVRLASAFIVDSAGTPTLTREDGDWINGALVDNGVGKVQININAGIFSVAPNCACTADPSRLCSIDRTSESATRIDLDLRDQAGSPSDEDFSVICVGAK